MPRGRPPKYPKAEHCTAPDCTMPVLAFNLCQRHYSKARRPAACPSGGKHVWTVLDICKHCGAERTD